MCSVRGAPIKSIQVQQLSVQWTIDSSADLRLYKTWAEVQFWPNTQVRSLNTQPESRPKPATTLDVTSLPCPADRKARPAAYPFSASYAQISTDCTTVETNRFWWTKSSARKMFAVDHLFQKISDKLQLPQPIPWAHGILSHTRDLILCAADKNYKHPMN